MAPRSTPNRTAGARKASAPTRTRATKAAPAPKKAKTNGTNTPVTKAASTPAPKRANGDGKANGNAKATSPARPVKRLDANVARRRRSAANDTPVNNTGLPKLHKGGLEALVLDHIAAHAKVEFSPSELANKLSRSSGAIANALAKFTEQGLVIQTSQRPRRYRFAGARSARRATSAKRR